MSRAKPRRVSGPGYGLAVATALGWDVRHVADARLRRRMPQWSPTCRSSLSYAGLLRRRDICRGLCS